MGKWILYTQLNYAYPKPAHLTPLVIVGSLYYKNSCTLQFLIKQDFTVSIFALFFFFTCFNYKSYQSLFFFNYNNRGGRGRGLQFIIKSVQSILSKLVHWCKIRTIILISPKISIRQTFCDRLFIWDYRGFMTFFKLLISVNNDLCNRFKILSNIISKFFRN